jgi:hypothetical protein
LKRPAEFSGESPLAQFVATFKGLAEYGRFFPYQDWVTELPLAIRSHTIGLRSPFVRHVVYPLCWAQRIMEEGSGDVQKKAREAIKVLEANCKDKEVTALCVAWLKVNHHV